MHPFPPIEQLNFLIGMELSNITLQPYSVVFLFVEGALVVCEHGVEYESILGYKFNHDPQKRLGPDPIHFHSLIGKHITKLEALTEYSLEITFEGGEHLILLSKTGSYESGQITGEGRYIVF